MPQCDSRNPETGARCVRPIGTHEEHLNQLATDVYQQRWTDSKEFR